MLSALLASGRSSFLILNNSVQEKPGQLSDSQSLEHSTQCKQLHLSCVCVCVCMLGLQLYRMTEQF